MRETLRCPKCTSREIGHFEQVFDEDGKLGTSARALARATIGSYFRGFRLVAAEVEAYVCTACGYFEEYVRDPKNVEWEQLPGFHWCRREDPEGPFR